MDIQDFVRESLCQIIEGVHAAKAKHPHINPDATFGQNAKLPPSVLVTTSYSPVFLAEFDLAVTATDKRESSGKAGIEILPVLSAGGSKSSGTETISATRIKFSVPISYQ